MDDEDELQEMLNSLGFDYNDPVTHVNLSPRLWTKLILAKIRSAIIRDRVIASIRDNTEIDTLVRQYLQEHPDFIFPESGDLHPAILASGTTILQWLSEKCEGRVACGEAMLRSAKIWFASGGFEREFNVFCLLFEAAANVSWDSQNERLVALYDDYNEWRHTIRERYYK